MWTRRTDRWNGVTYELPSGWKSTARLGATLVSDATTRAVALVWPDPLGRPGSVDESLAQVVRTLAAEDASLRAWSSPIEPLPGGGVRQRAALQRTDGDGTDLRGELIATANPHGGILATGWLAPLADVESLRPTLMRVLASFAPLDPVPRTRFVDPSEGAWSVLVPQGWRATGRVDRSRGQGNVTVTWSVDDPTTGARAYNDGTVIPFSAPMFGLGSLFGGAWNQQPYTSAVDLCQGLLVKLAQQQRPDLRLVSVVHDPNLERVSSESLRPVAAQFGGQARASGALATTLFHEHGRAVREVTAVTTWMIVSPMMAGSQWFATIGPAVRAPDDLFPDLESVLAGIVLSYQANQAWENQEIQSAGHRIAAERAQAEQYRARLWRETQDYCQQVNREIQERHEATNAEITRSNYNLIAGKEDVLGEGHFSYKVDSGYEYYWEKDDRIIGSNSSDLDAHLRSDGWKKMTVF